MCTHTGVLKRSITYRYIQVHNYIFLNWDKFIMIYQFINLDGFAIVFCNRFRKRLNIYMYMYVVLHAHII